MIYDYTNFSKSFCKVSTAECLKNIDNAQSFNLVAISGVGITFFLKYLESRSKDKFVFINTYEMPEFTKDAFFQQVVIKLGGRPSLDLNENIQKTKLLVEENLASHKKKLIFVFNRLDRLAKVMDQTLFDNLRFFRDQDRSRVIMIFVSSQKLIEAKADEIKDVLTLVSKTTYFKPYDQESLKEILKLNPMNIVENSAIVLSGGHHNLYSVLTRCQNLDNALSDPMVELLIKDMYFSLDRKKREDLNKATKGSKVLTDEYLFGTGMLKKVGNHLETFTPLLAEFIKEETGTILPVMENRLFSFLVKNKGNIVSKEEIFDEVWKEQDGIASEWSLNSLVYRLRNHSGYDKNRFVLKSVKKVGYVLYDGHDE